MSEGLPLSLRLRKVLEGFKDAEFDALCQDYFPDFYDDSTRQSSGSEKITGLLYHCRKKKKNSELIGALPHYLPDSSSQLIEELEKSMESSKVSFQVFVERYISNKYFVSSFPKIDGFIDCTGQLDSSYKIIIRSHSLVLYGEPGIGTSTLGSALAHRLVDNDTSKICWLSVKSGVTVQDLIWHLAHFLGDLEHPELIVEINRDLDRELDWKAVGEHVIEALNILGLVICIDDCQYLPALDEEANQDLFWFLQELVNQAQDYWVVLMGYKSLSPELKLKNWPVQGLTSEEAVALVAAKVETWPHELDKDLQNYLGGNPGLLEIFADILVQENLDSVEGIREILSDLGHYPTIREILSRFWETLSSEQQDVLGVVSLFPYGVSRDILKNVLSNEKFSFDAPMVLNSLTDRFSVLDTGGRDTFYLYRTKRKLIADHVDKAETRAWHGIIADTLDKDKEYFYDHLLEIIYHLFEARKYDEAWAKIKPHQEEILTAGQVPQVLDTLERFTNVMFEPKSHKWVDVCELRGRWQRLVGRYEAARESFRAALMVADRGGVPVLQRARLRRQLGLADYYQGKFAEAESRLSEAETLLKGAEGQDECRELGVIEYCWARIYRKQGDMPHAIARARTSLNLLAEYDYEQRVEVFNILAVAEFIKGEMAAGLDYLRQAESLIDTYSSLSHTPQAAGVYMNQGVYYFMQPDYEKSREYYQKAFDAAEWLSDKDTLGEALYNLGNLTMQLCCWEDAAGYLERCLELARKVGNVRHEAFALMGLGQLANLRAEWDEAEKTLMEALAGAEKNQLEFERFGALQYLARMYRDRATRGDWALALEKVTEALRICDSLDIDRTYHVEALALSAEVKARLGEHEGALKDAEAALKLAIENEDKSAQGIARTALGVVQMLVGDYEAAKDELKNALKLLQADCYEKSVALLRLGEAHACADEPGEAKARWGELLASAEGPQAINVPPLLLEQAKQR